jgi:DNA polymerase
VSSQGIGILERIGNISRSLVCELAPWQLIGGDFRAVESAYLATIAGEIWKRDGWAKAFRSDDSADDMYTQVGAWFGEDRDAGKVYDLALNFGGGIGSLRKRNPDLPFSDDELRERVRIYRARHPRTTDFRYGLERAAIAAVQNPTVPQGFMHHELYCREIGGHNFLCMELPSKRAIFYPDAHLVPYTFNGRNYQAVAFMENSQGRWRPYVAPGGKPYAWNGLFCENAVQAGCRDILAAAVVRLSKAGYQPILTVHDEIVCRMRKGEGSLTEFKYLIELLPEWAKALGMPLAAKVWRRSRWAEDVDATPVVHVPGAVITSDMLIKPQWIAPPEHLRPPAPIKMKAPKAARARKAELETGTPPPADARLTSPDPVTRLVGWAVEREAIRKRKEAGLPRPWTTNQLPGAVRCCAHACNSRGARGARRENLARCLPVCNGARRAESHRSARRDSRADVARARAIAPAPR